MNRVEMMMRIENAITEAETHGDPITRAAAANVLKALMNAGIPTFMGKDDDLGLGPIEENPAIGGPARIRATGEEDEDLQRPEALVAGGGLRYDAGKPRMDLIPPEMLIEYAKVAEVGAKKYKARNWERGQLWSQPFACAMRHLMGFWMGEAKDPETGLSHAAHALWNIAAIVTYEARAIGKDDRPPATPQVFASIRRPQEKPVETGEDPGSTKST